MAGDIANAATRTLINGSGFGDNIISALPDTIGQTIGNAFANSMSQSDGPTINPNALPEEKIQEVTNFLQNKGASPAEIADTIASIRVSNKAIINQNLPLLDSQESIPVDDQVFDALFHIGVATSYLANALEDHPYIKYSLIALGAVYDPVDTLTSSFVMSTPAGEALEDWTAKAADLIADEYQKQGYSPESSTYAAIGAVTTSGLAVAVVTTPVLVSTLKKLADSIPNIIGRLTTSIGAETKVVWVDENVGLRGFAREYNDSATGARSNPITKVGQAPALKRTLPDGTEALVKFDDVDGDVMIDRKSAVVTTPKAMGQALNQSDALEQNGLRGRWEVPNSTQQLRAVNMLNKLDIKNINVSVVKPW